LRFVSFHQDSADVDRHYLFDLFQSLPTAVIASKTEAGEAYRTPILSVTTEIGNASFQFKRKTLSAQLEALNFGRYHFTCFSLLPILKTVLEGLIWK